jgi:hypothetical protein
MALPRLAVAISLEQERLIAENRKNAPAMVLSEISKRCKNDPDYFDAMRGRSPPAPALIRMEPMGGGRSPIPVPAN